MLARILNNPAVRYLREAREELRKVTWPTRQEVIKYSLMVIIISVILAAYFGLLDWALTLGLEEIVALTH